MSTPLAVTEWGAGPTVVLIHGGTPQGGAPAFAAQRPLANRWRLVLPDRPGHGSTPRDGREDFERDAKLIAPLLEGGAHLVGHSYGGIVALLVAITHPASVRSLTLIEPPAYTLAPDDPAVVEMRQRNRELFEHPPGDHADLIRAFFSLVGINVPVELLPPEALAALARDLTDIRSPDDIELNMAAVAVGGYPLLVLTSGRTPGFEGVAEALVTGAGATHEVVAGTDHTVQNGGHPVNVLLEELWSRA